MPDNSDSSSAAASAGLESASNSSSRPPKPSNDLVNFKGVRTDSALNSFDLLVGPSPSPLEEQRIQRLIEDKLISTLHSKSSQVFTLKDLLPQLRSGMSALVEDDFSRCFETARPEPWNFTLYLWCFWIIGVAVRYAILFPIRAISLALGWIIFGLRLLLIKMLIQDPKQRRDWESANIRFLCSAFVFSWHGVIRYHGSLPPHKVNQIYVANHSSMIDVIVLGQRDSFSAVGQKHPGWVGIIQDSVIGCMGNCWFNRGEASDRLAVAKKIKAHIANPESHRLLVFPEGTCVNNEYVVQFKQGVFDMDAEICPIAIKYNKIFVDAFWNSRQQSFASHLMTLMRSWAVVADVYYMDSQKRRPNESAVDFSNRVKKLIARRAGLKNVEWDGYLKHFRPSSRYVQERQSMFANQLLKKLNENELAELENRISSPKVQSADLSKKMAAMISSTSAVNLTALANQENERKKEK